MKSTSDLVRARADGTARKGLGKEQWSEAVTVSFPIANKEKEFNYIKGRLGCSVEELKFRQKRKAKDCRSAKIEAFRHRRGVE